MIEQLQQLTRDLDEFKEFAVIKPAITAFAKSIGTATRVSPTGDRTYRTEADGTIFLQIGHSKTALNRWTTRHWECFREDVLVNRLLEKLHDMKREQPKKDAKTDAKRTRKRKRTQDLY